MIEDNNIKLAMQELKEKFEIIHDKNWIKTVSGGRGAVGLTFETELGIKHNSDDIPDYKGIEIKTKRVFSEYATGLFNAIPNGSFDGVVNYLNDFYGYPMKNNPRYKCLNNEIKTTKFTKIGLFNYFKLFVNKEKKRVEIQVYNRYFKLIEDDIYWDFDYLKDKLNKKLKYLAFVRCFKKEIDGVLNFRYANLDFYKLKNDDVFIDLIEKGIVSLNIKISSNLSGEFEGQSYSHGFTFRIYEKQLYLLFNKIKI